MDDPVDLMPQVKGRTHVVGLEDMPENNNWTWLVTEAALLEQYLYWWYRWIRKSTTCIKKRNMTCKKYFFSLWTHNNGGKYIFPFWLSLAQNCNPKSALLCFQLCLYCVDCSPFMIGTISTTYGNEGYSHYLYMHLPFLLCRHQRG